MTGFKCDGISDAGLAVVTGEGERRVIAADSIIPALPLTADKDLMKSFEGKFREVYVIGDCRQPGLIVDAIADGSRIAKAI